MEKQHVCPWWVGYTFILPIRKLQHNPQKILGTHIKPGMKVLDFGCAMGYFSIPLAQMVGTNGTVYCVDLQSKMLAQLSKRANKYKVSNIIEPLQVGKNYQPERLKSRLDFILLFMVAHEVPDQTALFNDLYSMLQLGGKVLFFEPKGHVKSEDFEKSLIKAKNVGFAISDEKPMSKGMCAILVKR